MLCCGGRPDSGVGERQTGRRQTGGAEKGWDLGMKGNGFWGFGLRRVEEREEARRRRQVRRRGNELEHIQKKKKTKQLAQRRI